MEMPAKRVLTPADLQLRGKIKVEPEDFVVEEIPAYEPAGTGEHLFLWVQKRDVSAEQLTQILATTFGVRRDEIGVAGLKDRWGVTRQWVSVASPMAEIPAAADDRIQILRAGRHANKLRLGHLRGNRFQIRIRTEQSDAFTTVRRAIDAIQQQGVPNYFGDQRFGTSGDTLELGMSLLRGETLPKSIPFHRRKFLLKLALSAAQSSLFNEVLTRRIDAGIQHQVQPGDVMQVTASGGLFVAEDAAAEQSRYDQRETVITGPIFGPKMKQPLEATALLEQTVLAHAGLTQEHFTVHKKLTAGARRPLMVWPENLAAAEDPSGVLLSFSLPPGCYATVVLDEFVRAE